jgi:hypothetical protein
MRCFNHLDIEAVGVCKHCSRGICKECVKDSGQGIACSLPCLSEIRSAYAVTTRNRKLRWMNTKSRNRMPIWFLVIGGISIAVGIWTREKAPPLILDLTVLGVILVFLGAEQTRKEMIDWLRQNYPGVKIIALNPCLASAGTNTATMASPGETEAGSAGRQPC